MSNKCESFPCNCTGISSSILNSMLHLYSNAQSVQCTYLTYYELSNA